jgi:Icc-related predicted phosphoesterase
MDGQMEKLGDILLKTRDEYAKIMEEEEKIKIRENKKEDESDIRSKEIKRDEEITLGNERCLSSQGNDDFIMLLEMMRQKKKHVIEENPYYLDRCCFIKEMLFGYDVHMDQEEKVNPSEMSDEFVSTYVTMNNS